MKTKKNMKRAMKKALELFMACMMVLSMVVIFPISVEAVDAISLDDDLKVVIGAGFDVTGYNMTSERKELIIFNLKTANPILDTDNQELYSHVKALKANIQKSNNMTAWSAADIAEQVTTNLSTGIDGKIKVVTFGVDAAFDKSKQVANATSEYYEYYYTVVANTSLTIALSAVELRNYLSPNFKAELYAVKSTKDAMALMSKYGTHLITGYNLGGKLEVTNYKSTSDASVNLANGTSLASKLGVSAGTSKGNASFSFSETYTQKETSSTQTSSYRVRLLGGTATANMTIDQLFQYNNAELTGEGNFMYQPWLNAINKRECLEIVSISNEGKAIPIWEFLEPAAENNIIRQYLVSAYVEMCGDSYNDFFEQYPTMCVNLESTQEAYEGTITITGYMSVTNDVVSTVSIDTKKETYSKVVPDTTLYMIFDDTTVNQQDVQWKIISGSEHATVEDAKSGVFRINPGTGGKEIKIGAYVDGTQTTEWTFQVQTKAFSGGIGTEESPYILSTVDDIQKLSQNTDYWKKGTYFVLADNVDFTGKDLIYWKMIGTESNPFNATFNGNYFSISNLTWQNRKDNYIGLFGVIGDSGTIKNLIVENASITISATDLATTAMAIGTIAGKNLGKITNCIVKSAQINIAKSYTSLEKNASLVHKCGAIVGENSSGTIDKCGVTNPTIYVSNSLAEQTNNKTIKTETYVGGAVGFDVNGTISRCYVYYDKNTEGTLAVSTEGASVAVIGNNTDAHDYVGGILGYVQNSTLDECLIDVPGQFMVKRKKCKNSSEYGVGTVVGYVKDKIEAESIFVREKTGASYKEDKWEYAPIQNGYGVASVEGLAIPTNEISVSGSFAGDNLVEVLEDNWCLNEEKTRLILKSFAIKELIVNTDDTKTQYYYNESYSPIGLKVYVCPGYGTEDDVEIQTYKINTSRYDKTIVSPNVSGIDVSLGELVATYPVKVNRCAITTIVAEDVSTATMYAGETYLSYEREVKMMGVLSNGERIDLQVDTELPYVTYPNKPLTICDKELIYGSNEIKVEYGDLFCSFIVEAEERELTGIVLMAAPQKSSYAVGEEFSTVGMRVQALYGNGTVIEIDNDDLELIGTTISEGENKIIVSYGAYVTTEEPVTVYGYQNFYIDSMPNKTEYHVGDAIDFTGMVLKYSADGNSYQTINVSACTVSQKKVDVIGTNSITITYNGYSTVLQVIGKTHSEQFSVTWVTGIGQFTEAYSYGETPKYNGSTSKPSDKTYTYTFSSWDKALSPIVADTTFTAQYEQTYINYTVSFLDSDGSVISKKENYHYGDTISVPVAPLKNGKTFLRWDKDVTTVDGNVTVYAVYQDNVPAEVTYTVTWIVGTDVTTETYASGETPLYKKNTEKKADNTYTYTFTGWDKTVVPVTKNVVYLAQYEQTYIDYTVTFVDWNNRIISQKKDYHYGDVVTVPVNPTREGFTFASWTPMVSLVSGNASYQAVYTEDSKLSVIWKVGDNTSVEYYAAGTIPSFKGDTSKASDNTYSYMFKGWDKTVVPVTQNVVYLAQYEQTYINYTVSFLDSDGSVILKKDNYHYGDVISVPANPTLTGKTFLRWDKEVSTVSGNLTVYAVYQDTTDPVSSSYTITWIVGNDVTTEQYSAGTMPTYKNSLSKNSDVAFTYAFAGWDKPIVTVTGNTTYTAVFDATAINYTVIFKDNKGNVISSKKDYHYGDNVTIPQVPSITGYSFAGWSPSIQTVTGNQTYTASYMQNDVDVPDTPDDPNVPGAAVLAVADVNSDGEITYADCVVLLRYLHFPNLVDVRVRSGDVNGDGQITADDAIYLQNYLYSPTRYPIG